MTIFRDRLTAKSKLTVIGLLFAVLLLPFTVFSQWQGDGTEQNPNLILENNFNDKQMVNQPATVVGDIAGKAESKLTSELTGYALQNILGDGWSYAPGRYPVPLGLENDSSVLLAATPVWLHYRDENSYNTVDSVSEHFIVGTQNNAGWSALENNIIIENQYATLLHVGSEQITTTFGRYSKTIALDIKSIPLTTPTRYTISGSVFYNEQRLENVTINYQINGTGEIYSVLTDENGYYEIAVNENSNITITPNTDETTYTFTPADTIFTNITQDIENVNFRVNSTGISTSKIGQNSFKIFPNPTHSIIQIISEIEIKKVEIYDGMGTL